MFTVSLKKSYWKRIIDIVVLSKDPRRFRAPQVWSASLPATAADPFIRHWLQMQAMREECLIRILSSIYLSIVHKGSFWDFITAQQEQASQQVIVLNWQREAVISCDYKKKYRTISVKSDTPTSPTFSLPKATEQPPPASHTATHSHRFHLFKCLYCFFKRDVSIQQGNRLLGRCFTPSALHLRLGGASFFLMTNFVPSYMKSAVKCVHAYRLTLFP